MKLATFAISTALVFLTAQANAADSDKAQRERAGNCEQAKSQQEFFCGNTNDMMASLGTACENAKKNVAAACEGKVEADKAYKFDK